MSPTPDVRTYGAASDAPPEDTLSPPVSHADLRPPRTQRWRRPLHLTAAAYAGATLVVQLVWWVFGDVWWLQPVNLTTFWWTLPALPLVALAILRGRVQMAALLAIPAALFLWAYGGQFIPGSAPAVEADLRVATFNTWVHAPDVDHVVAFTTDERPDVLLLQEVFPERFEALSRALTADYPNAWQADGTESVGGVAVFSRFPITDAVDIDAGGSSRATGVVTLDIDGTPLQVVAVHLVSPCPDCGRSLSQRLTLEATTRRAEVAAVVERLDPDVPVVVGGDLNSNDRSDAYRAFTDAGFDDPHRAVGSGPGFTWPARRFSPLLRIDWILTRGLDPVAEWVSGAPGSDHRPVVADLAFPA